MSVYQEREAIKKAYPTSKTWGKRVDKMPEAQVHAIYIKLRNQKRI